MTSNMIKSERELTPEELADIIMRSLTEGGPGVRHLSYRSVAGQSVKVCEEMGIQDAWLRNSAAFLVAGALLP